MGACFTRSRAVTAGAPRVRGLLGEPWPPVPYVNGAGLPGQATYGRSHPGRLRGGIQPRRRV